MLKSKKRENQTGEMQKFFFFSFLLERERLLSRIPINPTVGSLRDKKESRSLREAAYAWVPDL